MTSTPTTILTHSDRLTVHDLVQDIFQALEADNETGSHHGNNAAATEWARKYPYTRASLTALAKYVEDWGPE
jgi:hypothetical protein